MSISIDTTVAAPSFGDGDYSAIRYSEEDRLAWQMKHVDRMTWRSVAETLGSTISQARTRARRYERATDQQLAAMQFALFTLPA